MSAARFVSALLVLFCCTLFGRVRASSLEARTACERGLLEDIRDLERRMRFLRKPLSEIVSELAETGNAKELWLGLAKGLSAGLPVSEASKSVLKPDIGAEPLETLEGLLCSLGTGELEEELSRLKLAEERLKKHLEAAETECERKTKLIRRLSALAGAAAAILIL